MRTWDTFFPDVLPDVLGCPEPTVERHLLNAARRFCAMSRCWRDEIDPVSIQATRATYELYYPDESAGVELIGAVLDGQDIDLEVADGTTTAKRLEGASGQRRVLSQDLVNITVMPTPQADGTLVITAILQPGPAATGIPERIGDRYQLAIATGALASLLKINKAAWADARLSGEKEREFMAAVADARSKAFKANTNTRLRTPTSWY
jgi:hypothetical protein